MLKEILSPKSCAECRLCCGFDRDDSWENPVISECSAELIKENHPGKSLERYGDKSYRFVLEYGEDGLAYCPALSDTGCTLSADEKPFDCKIWPYRVMNKDGRLVLVLSPVCEVLYNEDRKRTEEFGKKLAPSVFSEAEKNPDIIKEYIEGYPIIAEKL